MNRELHACTAKSDESRTWKRRMTAALPSVEAKVTDAGEADVAQELGPAATLTISGSTIFRVVRIETPQFDRPEFRTLRYSRYGAWSCLECEKRGRSLGLQSVPIVLYLCHKRPVQNRNKIRGKSPPSFYAAKSEGYGSRTIVDEKADHYDQANDTARLLPQVRT